MKFHKFIESVYVSTNLGLGSKDVSPYQRAKASATKDLIDGQHKILKFLSKLEILGHFILVKLHLVKQPLTAQQMFDEANKASLKPDVAPVVHESIPDATGISNI